MGPRRGAVTRSSSSAANMAGQEPESPKQVASPSGQAAIPEEETSRWAEMVMSLEVKVFSLEAEITGLSSELEDCQQVIREWAGAFGGGGIADMRRDIEQMSIQIGLLQRAVSNAPVVAHDVGARLRIPEPKAYGGARDAKEVENFLFDMEQYFLAANVEDEARKVSTATMYLIGDAKLWWRAKYFEIQVNQVRLDTWALLREAIRAQFFPENVEYNARRALRKLEHTGSMQDYVKAFSALMLDIRNMSEKDKLFTFIEGLKPWARIELQRQRVTDLGIRGGAKSFRSNSNRGGGDRKPHAQSSSQGSSSRSKPQENRQGAPQRSTGCFLCDGPHRYRDCPKKQLMNGLATFTDKTSPAKPIEPQASASGVNDPKEDEDNVVPSDSWQAHPCHDRYWSYCNYLASAEVERLGLVLEKGVGRVKAINSAAQPIAGVAKSVLIKMGAYEGKTNLSIMVMDDFKLILGLDFLRDTCTVVLPHVDSLMMMGAKSCVIPTLVGQTGERNLSAMQFEKGCKRSKPSYLCTLHFDEIEKASGPIPGVIKKLLKEFENVMPDELPRKLPSKREVDHEIELVPGTKPPARAPY
ncbi:UNVERIFIED_CONTAM: hypothetical protein Slati_3754000 [Sesamum latifolium]|uniref:Retrotransposon gag domain-containing protein n=1 Tax=Sesamum latifolium TaxID=2727402 RepID=A0AAW2U3T2_9LAMI